jgi:hypothetical protein
MDCVSLSGDVFIGYAASLRWRRLSIDYSSTLKYQSCNGAKAKSSLQKIHFPKITDSAFQWSSKDLGINGIWKATVPPIEQLLYASDIGCIDWQCLQPHAKAEILTTDGNHLQGLGYVEHISISIPPWKLPIAELRWGRFLSNTHSLIWINWQGNHPLTLVFYNGVQAKDAIVTDHEVSLDGGKIVLALSDGEVIREGPLVKTALAVIPGIRKLFPAQSLRTYECKWRSRGILKDRQEVISEGWAIHEVVRFG